MNILLANDDGVNAPGLAALAKEMSKLGDVYVAAPEGERSSNSHHLTIMGRLRFQEKAVWIQSQKQFRATKANGHLWQIKPVWMKVFVWQRL